jgi:signal transduction histidine kinase
VQAAKIAEGNFQPTPVSERDDELRDLMVSLNTMAEQLARYEDQVRRNERLKLLGQLGGGIAHQLRNSAAGARLALELHGQECPLGAECESLGVALRQLKLMETYVQRLLTLGKQSGRPRAPVVLDDLAAEVVELVRPSCTHHGVALRYQRPAAPVTVTGDVDALRQVLVNLVVNAVEAAQKQAAGEGRPGEIEVEVFGRNGRAFVRVFDTGPGPAAGVQERLFEPFVSDKPDGTGLGLSVSRQVAESHGGSVRWRRDNDRTCFECELAE